MPAPIPSRHHHRAASTVARNAVTLDQIAKRRSDLACIHAAASALGMDTTDKNPRSEYRELLLQHGGHLSAADMTTPQRTAVIKHLAALSVARGIRPEGKAAHGQYALARKLWFQLGELGALEDDTPAALDRFCQRITHIASARFLPATEANKLIEALKAWHARAKAQGPLRRPAPAAAVAQAATQPATEPTQPSA